MIWDQPCCDCGHQWDPHEGCTDVVVCTGERHPDVVREAGGVGGRVHREGGVPGPGDGGQAGKLTVTQLRRALQGQE